MKTNPTDALNVSTAGSRYLVYAILGDQTNIIGETLSPKYRELVEVIAFDALRIAVRPIPQTLASYENNSDRLQEFSDVLSDLHRLGDILPFRFGTIVAADDVPKFFGPQKEALLRSLTKVASCVEINIRWAVPEEILFATSSSAVGIAEERVTGFSYLKGKWKSKLRDQHVESLLANTAVDIQGLVGEGCVAMRTSIRTMRTVCPEGERERVYSIARLDLLIRRSDYQIVLQSVAAIPFCSVNPTLISGPWPPFSFVESNVDSGKLVAAAA